MNSRHLAACFAGLALLGLGATLLSAQTPQPRLVAVEPVKREAIRPQLVKLRVEAEMLRLDYQAAQEALMDELKVLRAKNWGNGFVGVFGAGDEQAAKKDESEAARFAEHEKQYAAEESAVLTERKKVLSRRFRLLTEKQLELDDAERAYREAAR